MRNNYAYMVTNYFHYHIFGLYTLTINKIQSPNRKTKTNTNPNTNRYRRQCPDPNRYRRCCPDPNARIQKKKAQSEEELQNKMEEDVCEQAATTVALG